MRMIVQTWQLLQDGGAPEYMYHDRTAWRCVFFEGKTMDAVKDIHKEMLPIWAAFLCGYPLLHPYFLTTKTAQRHAVQSWYMYSGAPSSCNSCYVCTVMCIPIVVHHNKTG
jgi:hypothetical protein